jgi:hypothetical protein
MKSSVRCPFCLLALLCFYLFCYIGLSRTFVVFRNTYDLDGVFLISPSEELRTAEELCRIFFLPLNSIDRFINNSMSYGSYPTERVE